MDLNTWIILYSVDLIFWLWIIFWGGAESAQGGFLGYFVLGYLANSSVEGIKLGGWLFLIITTGWFVIGVLNPDLRIVF